MRHNEAFISELSEETSDKSVTGIGFLVLTLLFVSFAYELPLVNLTRYDRLNPRLFDVAAGILAFYWLFAGRRRGWHIRLGLPVVRPWCWVTVFFGIATVGSFFFIPYETYLFSVFYFLKYLEVLVVVLIFSAIPFTVEDKRKLLWVALWGGVWVSFYAIMQYAGLVSTHRILPTGKEINMFRQGVYSTLGVTYYHLGMFGVLSCLIGFTLFASSRFGMGKLLAMFFTLLCFIPAMISGSKAGLMGLGIALALTMTQREYRGKIGVYLLMILVVAIGYQFFSKSVARERIEKGSGGTPAQRFMMGFDSIQEIYEMQGPTLLAVGGGFYVVPGKSNPGAKPNYRVGYGNHNIFLFPLEQAGIGGFIAALCLWVSIAQGLSRRIRDSVRKSLESVFATSMRTYLVVVMIVGVAGQVFYLGFGTEHFTVYQLLLYILATLPAVSAIKPVPEEII